MKRRKNAYVLFSFLRFLSSLTGLFIPWYLKNAVDSIKIDGGSRVFTQALLLMLLFAFLQGLFRFFGRRGFLVLARDIEGEIREDLFGKVITAPYPFYDSFATGDIMSRAVNDLNSIWLLVGPGFLTLIGSVFTYVVGIFFLLRIDSFLTLLVFILVPLAALFGRVYSRRLYRLHRSAQETLSLISDRLNNFITGIRIIKSYTMEKFVGQEFSRTSEDYCEKNVEVSKVSALFHGTFAGVTGFGVLFVLAVGGLFVIEGRISLGGFVAFTSYIGILSYPAIAVGWIINLYQRGASAAGRIQELMEVEGEPGGVEEDDEIQTLELAGVRFSYLGGGDIPVLDGVDLLVEKGEAIGITGLTGSGKSTIVKLLLGFYEPDEGEIRINGKPLASFERGWIRKKIGVVFQDPHLFSETVLENISFPLEEPSFERSVECARLASVDQEIDTFPGQYQAVIGERGVTLSGGQKQRLTVARTICHESEVIVLDDSFSSVDGKTEKSILHNLSKLKGKKTIILITHRLSSLSLCDRIVVMDGGRVIEEGTEEELVKRRGLFFRFSVRQSLEGLEGR
jgi:ATP-binding cassette subfamily B protein